MEQLKQAYELLGLQEDADKEELEKRYYLLIRRTRSVKQRKETEGSEEANTPDLEDINRAYKLILAHEAEKTNEAFNKNAYGKYKKMAGSAAKVDHFFSYYKFHLIGSIAVILILIFGIKTYVDSRNEQAELAKLPPANVAVSFFGEFINKNGLYPSSEDIKPMEAALLAQFPEWKRVIVSLTYVPSEMRSEQDTALIQKSVIDLMTTKTDMYIMDRVNFLKLAQAGALLPLDDKLNTAYQDKALKAANKDEPTIQHIYGYDISNSSLIKGLPILGKEYIAGIRFDAKKPDGAAHFIEKYLSK